MTQYLAPFFSGVFLFNAIPHLVRGICGKRHMTPFARRSGPATNVIWAWVNGVVGLCLLKACPPAEWGFSVWIAFCAGGFITSLSLAVFWTDPEARLPWHRK